MPINDVHELFEHKLRQQYYTETQLVDALDQMAMNASNDTLRSGFADHRDETREHVSRLETVFDEIGSTPAPTENPVLDALEDERREIDDEISDDDLQDMAYMTAGMMTERIEMTAYEGLLLMATRMDHGSEITDPLEANHDDEESAYHELDAMASGSEMKSFWDRITPS